ncbi:N-acetylneuraminate synthase [Paenibacillus sp. GCM10012307]|uniref:N-acetylneuraminate synthase n=1 Tax=Paenibacillus roseus TaxID=2798579 RepID=A0A934J348_9BACL|nr:N-acetylneuraminate synthase [Paenibacillus roseus]
MKKGRVTIIAEIGVNHNGSLQLAKQLVEVAADAGADAVKLQTFRADRLVSRQAAKAEYQRQTTDAGETQYDMLRRLELSVIDHEALLRQCRELNIELLSTPFDLESADMLTRHLGLGAIKVSSGDATNAPLLVQLGRSGKPVLLSTGMCTLADVEEALSALAFGYTRPIASRPSRETFRHAYLSAVGRQALAERVTLLHATTEYPAPYDSINLQAMDTLSAAFGLPVGLSDHTEGIAVAIAAAARGAAVIEKHLTLDCGMEGPDHQASLAPAAFRELVRSVRQVEASLGSSLKIPAPQESENAKLVRRSLIAAQDIDEGEVLTEDHLAVKRPGGGLSPFAYWELLGTRSKRAYRKDELLE